ncbi:MAG TPA: MG2 domain-containing protein, partial [Polyangiaceae bacterium]
MSVILGGLFILGAACMESAKAPSKSPNGALGPGAVAGIGKKDATAFRVVFAGPQGEASEVSELSLVFSRPLRKLELAGAAAPALSLAPNVAGRWLWVGTHALHFVPEAAHLPGATEFTVTVPAELRALDGATLGTPYQFSFSTPRPKLVQSEPEAGARGLEPNTFFTLRFNQPIDPLKFQHFTKLTATHARKEQALAFSVVRPDPTQPKRLEVHPALPLPIDSQIKLSTSEELASLEGPLPMGTAIDVSVETYGPLVVSNVNCDRDTPHENCAPGGSWSIELSNPVPIKDLKRALSITPALPLSFENWSDESTPVSYLSVSAPFQAGHTYALRISGDMHDVHGQKLSKPFAEEMQIDDYFPQVEIGVNGALLDPRVATSVPIGSVNVKNYDLTTAALSPEDVLRVTSDSNPDSRWTLFQSLASAKKRSVVSAGPANHINKENLSLSSVLGDAKHGPVAIGVRYEKHPKDYRSPSTFKIVKLTDLALTAKLSVDGSLVWVTRVSTGEPVAKAAVRVIAPSGEHRYETDAQGIALVPARDFAPNFDLAGGDADALLIAKSGDDWTYESARDYLSPWRLSVPIDLSGRKRTYGLIFTERGIYRPGDEVQVKGIVRRELASGNANPAGEELSLLLRSPDSEELQKQTVKLSRFGTFAARFKVPESGHLGSWQVQAASSPDDLIYESFDVSEYRPSEFKVGVESERPSYVRGDVAHWTARADYLFGAPMAKAAARVTVSHIGSYFEVPNSEGFSTSASAYHADLEESALDGGQLLAQAAKLDEHGAFAFSQKLELPAQRGPELITAEADVTDVSRQSLAGTTSAIVHPAEFYLGLKEPEDFFVNAPGKVSTSVLALSPKGERVAGKSVKIELVSRRWTYAREAQKGNDSRLVSKVVDRVVGSCTVTTATTPTPCAIDVP